MEQLNMTKGTEWRWPAVGYLYVSQGVGWAVLYVPCLVVMSREEYRQSVGYKLMLALGPVDLVSQGVGWAVLYVPCLVVMSREEYRQSVGYKLMLALGPVDLVSQGVGWAVLYVPCLVVMSREEYRQSVGYKLMLALGPVDLVSQGVGWAVLYVPCLVVMSREEYRQSVGYKLMLALGPVDLVSQGVGWAVLYVPCLVVMSREEYRQSVGYKLMLALGPVDLVSQGVGWAVLYVPCLVVMSREEYRQSVGYKLMLALGPVDLVSQGVGWAVLYVPCLVVMSREEYRQSVGYKLMLALGPVDLTILAVGGVVTGYYTVIGLPLPERLVMATFLGSVAWAFWNAYTLLTLCIALSRYLALSHPLTFTKLFDGRRTWYWVGASYSVIPLFLYLVNAGHLTCYYRTRYGNAALGTQDMSIPITAAWNIAIVIVVPALYIAVVRRLRQQSGIISALTAFTAAAYIVMPSVTDKPEAFVFNQLVWYITTGGNSLIYLGLNASVRHDWLVLLRLRKAAGEKPRTVRVASKGRTGGTA